MSRTDEVLFPVAERRSADDRWSADSQPAFVRRSGGGGRGRRQESATGLREAVPVGEDVQPHLVELGPPVGAQRPLLLVGRAGVPLRGELIPVAKDIVDNAYTQSQSRPRGSHGDIAWPGLLRRLNRIDPSYQD